MNSIRIFLSATIIMSLLGCGLEQMAVDYDKVVYEQTPMVLEAHGGKVSINLKGKFPERYFAKKAIVEITPVIIDENGGESKLNSITLQGEQATGGDATIFFESGGKFSYADKIDYTDEMINSTLELRALATLEDDNKVLGPVTIASGVIATSMRVKNDEILAFADHGYQEIETTSETATIYFLVNKSNIRTTEKSDEDVQKLKEFIKLGYKTESFVVKSSASPEGTEKINTELSDDRQNSTLTYAKYLLKKLKADGASDDDNYKLSSAGADWDGFNKLVESSTIAEKSTILSLSNRHKEKTQKERGELLQDMAQIYDALEGDVLQYLRKSEITINSYVPKKTREEIVLLSSTNPSELSVEELLYSATLKYDWPDKVNIYNKVIELHNDWRAYNNIACIYLTIFDTAVYEVNRDFDASKLAAYVFTNLNKSIENGGANEPDVLTNLGIAALWFDGDIEKAEELFTKANTSNYNKATLSLRKGDYRSASRYYRGQNTYNATLANILNGNNNSVCSEKTAECYYLNAIAGSRADNETILFYNLEKAINADILYKSQAVKDLEFLNYRENEKFISLTK